MNATIRLIVSLLAATALAAPTFALSSSAAGDMVKAQVIIGKVMKLMELYQKSTVKLEAPTPIADNSGAFLLPYKADGQLTEWAQKSFSAQAGKAVGAKAGDAATNAVASKVPFGGLAGGLIKKKTKEVGAVVAMGGMDFIKKSSELSMANLDDYAVYLHVLHSADANYQLVLATAIALYPDLETRFDGAISQAYKKAAAAQPAAK